MNESSPQSQYEWKAIGYKHYGLIENKSKKIVAEVKYDGQPQVYVFNNIKFYGLEAAQTAAELFVVQTTMDETKKKTISSEDTPNQRYPDFQDKRKRTWEWFIDSSYYDLICVRAKGERDFNSQLSFHFVTYREAKEFVELLKQSS